MKNKFNHLNRKHKKHLKKLQSCVELNKKRCDCTKDKSNEEWFMVESFVIRVY